MGQKDGLDVTAKREILFCWGSNQDLPARSRVTTLTELSRLSRWKQEGNAEHVFPHHILIFIVARDLGWRSQ